MPITINPEIKFHVHKLETTPTMNIQASVNFDGTWYMHNDPSMLFTLNGQNVPEIHGGGQQDVQIKLTNAVNNYDQGIYELKLRVFNFYGTEEDFLTVFLLVSDTTEKVIKPDELHFEAIRNVQNAPEQRFFIASSSSGVTVMLPAFLELVSHELNGGGHIVTVKPVIQGSTLDPFYSDDILITFPDSTTKLLPVFYTIHAGYDDDFTRPVHFTRQNDELVFYKTTPEPSFLRLKVELKTFDDSGSAFFDELIDLDLPFVDNKAKLNLGKEIESYLFNDMKFQFSPKTKGVYPPAETRITAIEFKYPDYDILNQDVLPLLYFLRGRNPLKSGNVGEPFWAEFRPQITRLVSQKAVISLSIFKPALQPIRKFTMKKNGEFVKYIQPYGQTFGQLRPGLATATVDLSDIQTEPGDEITFEYDGHGTKKTFIVSPPVKNSILIAYQTVFNTFELFEFTGSMTGEVEYTHDFFEYILNFVRKSKKIHSEKQQKFTINTGWILADEVFLVDEMIEQRKAFLLPPVLTGFHHAGSVYDAENNHHIELIPQSSKITNYDSDSNQYQIDVEFLINPKYENEIYSR